MIYYIDLEVCIYIYIPWKSKVKQRMVVRMIHVKNSLLPRGKVWSLDFLGIAFVSSTYLKKHSDLVFPLDI